LTPSLRLTTAGSFPNVARGGKSNFLFKSANRKSANSWAHSAIANPQICLKTALKVVCLKTILLILFKFKLEHYMKKVCICGLAEV
jgi:hypothetical protein